MKFASVASILCIATYVLTSPGTYLIETEDDNGEDYILPSSDFPDKGNVTDHNSNEHGEDYGESTEKYVIKTEKIVKDSNEDIVKDSNEDHVTEHNSTEHGEDYGTGPEKYVIKTNKIKKDSNEDGGGVPVVPSYPGHGQGQ